MTCKKCNGRGQIQSGLAGEELEPCPDCNPRPCFTCHGDETIDSGGFTPWGSPILLPCPDCDRKRHNECAAIGAAWFKDSSLEKWFPLTAQELAKLKELNEDKFRTIQAYCAMASMDKWKIGRLIEAIDQFISAHGHDEQTKLLTAASGDVINAKPENWDPKETIK